MLSWYDALEARFLKENPHGRESFTRILYVARLVKGVSVGDTQAYHQQIMEQLQSYNEARITGMLLITTNAVLHLLEGPAEILTSLLRHFNLSSAGMSYKYDEIRILLSSEDCPERRLPCWTHHVLQSQIQEKDVAVDKTRVTAEVFDLYSKLVDFGQLLVHTPGEGEAPRHQSQLRRALGQLPSNERLLAYSSSPDVPSLEEYLDIYDAPVEVTLEDEKVWPLPRAVLSNLQSS